VTPTRPTIRDVALAAGVSTATVSRVLRGETHHIRPETRERVEAAARRLGFQPNLQAAALRAGRTYVVALILSDIANPFWPDFARGVQHVARLEGYQVVLANSDWERDAELEYLAMARRARFDGIIINPGRVADADLLETGIPTVVTGTEYGFAGFDVVTGDIERGALDILRHLCGLGHHRIGFVGLQAHGPVGQKRLAEYRAALAACGVSERPDYVVEAPYTQDGGRAATARLLALPEPPTAIVASNDQQAIGALAEAQALGRRVPRDLSIVGIDGIEAAAVTTPPLTTLRVDRRRLGETAMRFLIERIEGDGPAITRRRREPCELLVRGTTAPPREMAAARRDGRADQGGEGEIGV
jgi:DNA-binding LacI/PurR family transcriptional regulator